jgi:hypothetical protein
VPQYLIFEKDGVPIGKIATGNKGETRYDVCWLNPNETRLCFFQDVDTGVQRQPQDQGERIRDFKNDFTHARRAIAATTSTANRFLEELPASLTLGSSNCWQIVIRLRTNQFDRGMVDFEAAQSGLVSVRACIGSGSLRPDGAIPADPVEIPCEAISLDGAASGVGQALQALASVGPHLLEELAKYEQRARQ